MARVSRIYDRRDIEQAFLEAFDRSGGVDRLLAWGSREENYGEFLKLMIKFAPKEIEKAQEGRVLQYRSNIPSSALNVHAISEGVLVDGED